MRISDWSSDVCSSDLQAVARVKIAFDPVVGCTVTKALQGFRVCGFFAIQFGTAKEHLAQAEYDRRVGITFFFALGMVLAVNRHPFFGDHTRGQPKPEAKEMHDSRMQVRSEEHTLTYSH